MKVSSDGEHYAKFRVIYLGTAPVDPFGAHDPSLMHGFAGRHVAGVGTPFNLDELKDDRGPASLVDLGAISSIRRCDWRACSTPWPTGFDPYPTGSDLISRLWASFT